MAWDCLCSFYEGLTCSYPHANDRFHTFLLEGVPGSAQRLKAMGIGYIFHLRRRRTDTNDALYRLAANAAAVVTDDYPVFVANDHNRSVPAKLTIPYYAVDSSCIVPMSAFRQAGICSVYHPPQDQESSRRVPAIPSDLSV